MKGRLALEEVENKVKKGTEGRNWSLGSKIPPWNIVLQGEPTYVPEVEFPSIFDGK